MDTLKITLKNNTDYRNKITFTNLEEVREFISQYYQGEPGNAYWESWTVSGSYPDEIFDILSPDETEEGVWHLV